MQRRRVDNKHAQCSTHEDTDEVPFVADNTTTKGICELRFDGEDVEALCDEDREVDDRLGLAERVNLARSANGFPPVVDKVGTTLGEIP